MKFSVTNLLCVLYLPGPARKVFYIWPQRWKIFLISQDPKNDRNWEQEKKNIVNFLHHDIIPVKKSLDIRKKLLNGYKFWAFYLDLKFLLILKWSLLNIKSWIFCQIHPNRIIASKVSLNYVRKSRAKYTNFKQNYLKIYSTKECTIF
jgi:hypothetical protein